jgi:hypothetical protein
VEDQHGILLAEKAEALLDSLSSRAPLRLVDLFRPQRETELCRGELAGNWRAKRVIGFVAGVPFPF